MGRPCARGQRFKMVLTRAPLAPKTEDSAAKAVRNAILHGEILPKMEYMAGKKCAFPYVKLMISCFHEIFDNEVIVGSL